MKLNLNNAALVLTAGLTKQLPGNMNTDLPQIAMCGRSNVGKSSLINKLLNRKKLARVSSEPGKTVTVNCYEVDKSLYLVDLPGYGYAKRSFDERKKWKALIDKYFSIDAPRLYLQLIDLKVGVTKDDAAMLEYLKQMDFPFAVVATKADKLNKTNKLACYEKLKNNENIPEDCEIIMFSSETGEGCEALWGLIHEFIDSVSPEETEK